MITRSVQPSPPLAADGAALARVLHQAGVAKNSLIWVTGPAGLAALIWLNREGYGQASYAHANRIAAMDAADALLIPHACGPADLAQMLRDAKCLREGGVLIAQIWTGPSSAWPGDAVSFIESLGFHVEGRLAERGRTICIARRIGHGDQRVAA
jgi:hypothetical protein